MLAASNVTIGTSVNRISAGYYSNVDSISETTDSLITKSATVNDADSISVIEVNGSQNSNALRLVNTSTIKFTRDRLGIGDSNFGIFFHDNSSGVSFYGSIEPWYAQGIGVDIGTNSNRFADIFCGRVVCNKVETGVSTKPLEVPYLRITENLVKESGKTVNIGE